MRAAAPYDREQMEFIAFSALSGTESQPVALTAALDSVRCGPERFITFQQLLWFPRLVCRAQIATGVPQQVRKRGGHGHHRGFASPLQH